MLLMKVPRRYLLFAELNVGLQWDGLPIEGKPNFSRIKVRYGGGGVNVEKRYHTENLYD